MLLFGEAVVRQAEVAVASLGEGRPSHFEHRYRSIDRALAMVGHRNIVEIGAGLSFRGLAAAQSPGIHYLDTDLPELVAVKADLMARLDHLGDAKEIAQIGAVIGREFDFTLLSHVLARLEGTFSETALPQDGERVGDGVPLLLHFSS